MQGLLDLHYEDVRLARRLMAVQERLDALERLASAAIDAAAACVADEDAVDRAVTAAEAAMRAGDDEFEAAVEWATHLEQSVAITSSAGEFIKRLDVDALSPAPAPRRTPRH